MIANHLYLIYFILALFISSHLFSILLRSPMGIPSVMHTFLKGIYIIFIFIFLFETLLLYGKLNFYSYPELLICLFRISLIPKYTFSFYILKFGISLISGFRKEKNLSLIFLLSVPAVAVYHLVQPLKIEYSPLNTDFLEIGYFFAFLSMGIQFIAGILFYICRDQFKSQRGLVIKLLYVGVFFWFSEIFEIFILLRPERSIQLFMGNNLFHHLSNIIFPFCFLVFSLLIYSIFVQNKNIHQPEVKIRVIQKGFELTEREREVLAAILEGYSNDEIQERLCIAKSTVKSHINKIFFKCDVKSRLELIYLFLDTGSISRSVRNLEPDSHSNFRT